VPRVAALGAPQVPVAPEAVVVVQQAAPEAVVVVVQQAALQAVARAPVSAQVRARVSLPDAARAPDELREQVALRAGLLVRAAPPVAA
jgi:hypothetical protein